jgi:hypothetical protein
MSKEKRNKNEKYCPTCKQWLPKVKFSLEGKDRLDKDGDRARRRICSPCIWQAKKLKKDAEKRTKEETFQNLVNGLIELSRHDLHRLEHIDEIQFVTSTNAYDQIRDFDFEDIKRFAEAELYNSGLHRQEKMDLPPGTYLVVGDSHGKFTKQGMFDLMGQVMAHLNVDKIIHVGHLLDDDNHINRRWQDFDDLIVLAGSAEARKIEKILDGEEVDTRLEDYLNLKGIDNKDEYREIYKPNFDFHVVRKEITIGNVHINNQHMIRDYVKTPISRLDACLFNRSTITNLHRVEMDYRLVDSDKHFVMSPGCLCEKHVIRTIKQIDYTDGGQVKLSYDEGYIKYRRMRHYYDFWQQGMVVVQYDGDTVTSVPVRIHNIDGEYVTSYGDKIITSSGVTDPDRKIFVNADMHAELHDGKTLDIQEQVVRDYEPDVYVNLGDTANGSALNHHQLDRKEVILDEDIVREFGVVNYIVNRTATWADERYILYGNHERFLRDYTNKCPQLKSLINFAVLSGIEEAGFHLVGLKEVLEIGGMHFLHGDTIFFGKSGSKMERASSSYGPSMVGHVHYPSSRLECHSVGMSAVYDHSYNEPAASRWTKGFAKCNQYKGHSFVLNYGFNNDRVLIGSKLYTSEDGSSWSPNVTGIKISYEYGGPE